MLHVQGIGAFQYITEGPKFQYIPIGFQQLMKTTYVYTKQQMM